MICILSEAREEISSTTSCEFVLVENPVLDLTKVYDEAYFRGRGADPLVDYEFELEEPERTIRQYEWRGIATVVFSTLGKIAGIEWLDFGAGAGGLVSYLN